MKTYDLLFNYLFLFQVYSLCVFVTYELLLLLYIVYHSIMVYNSFKLTQSKRVNENDSIDKLSINITKLILTLTLKTSSESHALSCIMSFTHTLIVANILQSSAMPPGLSLNVAWNFTNLPSMANALSKHLPNIEVSMLPPQSNKTTLKQSKYQF